MKSEERQPWNKLKKRKERKKVKNWRQKVKIDNEKNWGKN